MTHRPLYTIAREIRANWPKVNYAAEPYLSAMETLNSIHDNYYEDSARSVVLYFLANAQSFKGEKARAIKAELNTIAKIR